MLSGITWSIMVQKKRDFDQNYASIDVSILYNFLSVGGFVGISFKNHSSILGLHPRNEGIQFLMCSHCPIFLLIFHYSKLAENCMKSTVYGRKNENLCHLTVLTHVT